MVALNAVESVLLCIHFHVKLNSISRKVFLASLKQSNFSWKISSKECSDSEFCIYINSTVWFKSGFSANILEIIRNSKSSIFYFEYQKLNPKKFLYFDKSNLPAWSPERFLSVNYLGPVILVNQKKIDKTSSKEFGYSAIYSHLLNFGGEKIEVNSYLDLSLKQKLIDKNYQSAVENFVANNRPNSELLFGPKNLNVVSNYKNAPKKISVIIPTRGTRSPYSSKSLIEESLESLALQTLYDSTVEVVIVFDEDSNLGYLESIKKFEAKFEINLIPFSDAFNFSTKCNLGAKKATGEVFVFLNDDTQWINPIGLLELAGTAMIPDVGAVGAKLFFANGLIQHAGIVVIDGNVGHAYFKQKNPRGKFGDLVISHEVSGVTGACLTQRKSIWKELGGWNENFSNSYNDVEYGFRIRESGYRVIQNNQVDLFHFESLTRDPTYSPKAYKLLTESWHEYLTNDPYFQNYVAMQSRKRITRKIAKKFIRKLLIKK